MAALNGIDMRVQEPNKENNPTHSDQQILQRYGWLNSRIQPIVPRSNVPISIGVLSYNRREDLRRTLECLVHHLDYHDVQIIVVDNASVDDSVRMVRENFPQVEVVELSENTGTAGRNEFIRRSRGKYIFCCDDDSLPATPQTVTHVVEFMEKHPDIDMLSMRCIQPRTGIDETKDFAVMGRLHSGEQYYDGLYVFECACCMRATAVQSIDGFESLNIWGAEGMELGLRMFDHGMKLIWHPGFETLHFKQWQHRPKQAGAIWSVQHRIAVMAKFFPMYVFVPLCCMYLMRRIAEIVMHPSRASGILQGIVSGLRRIPEFRRRYRKFSLHQMKQLKPWFYGVARW